MFELSIGGALLRFYLMVAVVVVLGVFNQFALAAVLGFALAGSFILGISVRKEPRKVVAKGRKRDFQTTVSEAA